RRRHRARLRAQSRGGTDARAGAPAAARGRAARPVRSRSLRPARRLADARRRGAGGGGVPHGGPAGGRRHARVHRTRRRLADRRARLRRSPALRRLVRETRLDPSMLVLPMFVDARLAAPAPVDSLTGHFRWPAKRVTEIATRAAEAGLGGLLLFGLPEVKDDL